jgi:hypothetical protein
MNMKTHMDIYSIWSNLLKGKHEPENVHEILPNFPVESIHTFKSSQTLQSNHQMSNHVYKKRQRDLTSSSYRNAKSRRSIKKCRLHLGEAKNHHVVKKCACCGLFAIYCNASGCKNWFSIRSHDSRSILLNHLWINEFEVHFRGSLHRRSDIIIIIS